VGSPWEVNLLPRWQLLEPGQESRELEQGSLELVRRRSCSGLSAATWWERPSIPCRSAVLSGVDQHSLALAGVRPWRCSLHSWPQCPRCPRAGHREWPECLWIAGWTRWCGGSHLACQAPPEVPHKLGWLEVAHHEHKELADALLSRGGQPPHELCPRCCIGVLFRQS
jgi:hypothetical protein